METGRRQWIRGSLLAATAALTAPRSKAELAKFGMPGPYPGRVIAVEHPGCIASGAYQPEPIRQMMERGMKELTGAPSWQDAWRSFFEKGDVVGIKVSPVGGAKLCSDASVMHSILDGLNQAGVTNSNIVVFNRYREEAVQAGIPKWLPAGVHFDAASERYNEVQLDMGGYDENHFMEMALIKPGDNPNDPHVRRSYVAKVVASRVNKIINLPVLKHHQSAGVTITLEKHVTWVCQQRESQPLDTDVERMRSVHSLGGQPAHHSAKSSAAHCRCGEGAVSWWPWRQTRVHVGAENDVLRHGSGRAGQDGMESDRCETEAGGHGAHSAVEAGRRQSFSELPGGAHRNRGHASTRRIQR